MKILREGKSITFQLLNIQVTFLLHSCVLIAHAEMKMTIKMSCSSFH